MATVQEIRNATFQRKQTPGRWTGGVKGSEFSRWLERRTPRQSFQYAVVSRTGTTAVLYVRMRNSFARLESRGLPAGAAARRSRRPRWPYVYVPIAC